MILVGRSKIRYTKLDHRPVFVYTREKAAAQGEPLPGAHEKDKRNCLPESILPDHRIKENGEI